MKKLGRENLQIRILFGAVVIVMVMVLLPLFLMGHYNFMSVDDFSFAYEPKAIWEETHSVIKVLINQMIYAKKFWNTWQGAYVATWFNTSLAGICCENLYFVGTYLSLGGFVISEIFLFAVILKKILRADGFRTIIVSGCIICLQVLLTTVPVEAFYWLCGAATYTVAYNETIFLIALLILLYDASVKTWRKVLYSICIALLTILVAGGTYVTLIEMMLIYFFITIWYWYKKNPNRWIVTAGMVLYLMGSLLNILAPGNQARLSAANATDISAIGAIFRSLKEAAAYIISNMYPPCIILGIMFIPIFMNIVKRKDFKYPLPLLVSFISFGLFAAEFTPTLYTLGILGAGRIRNIYLWTLYIWLYGNELYWIGWLLNRHKSKQIENVEKKENRFCFLLPYWFIGGILLCFSLYLWGGDTLTTVSAVKSLRNGEAQNYYAEYQERLSILEDDTIKDAQLKPFSEFVYLLYFGDITDDPNDWTNSAMAGFYNKDSVVLVE